MPAGTTGQLFDRLIRATFVAFAFAAACVVSPIPQPPNVQPELDLTDVRRGTCSACTGDRIEIAGSPGSLSHPQGASGLSLWVVNLDLDTPATTFPIMESDGSFSIAVEGARGDSFRLQARSGDIRGRPFDVVIPEVGDLLVEIDHPLADCLSVEPELDFAGALASDVQPIELQNLCDSEIAVDGVDFRMPTDSFAIGQVPGSIPPFDLVSFGIEWTGVLTANPESILFVRITGDVPERRVVTIISPMRD